MFICTVTGLANTFVNSDREEHLRKADNACLLSEEANKFSSQASSITFNDISTCIDV
jgi:hypothetical protein